MKPIATVKDVGYSRLQNNEPMFEIKEKPNLSVFYSYSHKDEKLRDRLEIHLSILKREGVISQWHDRRISAGLDWKNHIDEHLNGAQIILLLVSADFL